MTFIKGHKFYKGGEKGWFKDGSTGLATQFKKGHKPSKICIEKSKERMKGNKLALGNKLTEIQKKVLSENNAKYWLGKKRPELSGFNHFFFGKKRSVKVRQKISDSLLGRFRGEESPNWIDGGSYLPYSSAFNQSLKNKIRQRDSYICQKCGRLENEEVEELNVRLSIHHIDYDKMNCNENNLITLCMRCNTKVNFGREIWINFFKQKICV